MKTRILTAILLSITLTAYNQAPRRAQQDNEKKSNSRTYDNKQDDRKRETVKPEQKKENRNQESESRRTYKPADRQEKTDRVVNKEQDHRSQPHSREGIRRDPDNRVIVNDQKHETRQKVIIRDNKPVTRTYVHIERPVREVVVVHHPQRYKPVPVHVRRVNYPYRVPVHTHIYWSITLRNDFRVYYPEVRYWRYDIGYPIPVAPAYDAEYYIGDVARIYGKVFDVYYEYKTDEYYLYFGDYFPYHDFSIVVPGIEARAFSRRPERFFTDSHIAVTGYVSDFDEKPEMVIRRASQIEVY